MLTSGWWPNFPAVNLALPGYVTACEATFREFYSTKTQNRKLTWVHASGTVTVKATLGKAGSYELSLSALQAAALLLFNEKPGPLTFAEVVSLLGCEPDVAKRIMHSLACNAKFKVRPPVPFPASARLTRLRCVRTSASPLPPCLPSPSIIPLSPTPCRS